jgi:hypothetical protein
MNLEYIDTYLDNKYIKTLIYLVIISTVAITRPELPQSIQNLFKNNLVRLIVISYILYMSNNDFQLSLILTLAFLLIIHYINKQDVKKDWEKLHN